MEVAFMLFYKKAVRKIHFRKSSGDRFCHLDADPICPSSLLPYFMILAIFSIISVPISSLAIRG